MISEKPDCYLVLKMPKILEKIHDKVYDAYIKPSEVNKIILGVFFDFSVGVLSAKLVRKKTNKDGFIEFTSLQFFYSYFELLENSIIVRLTLVNAHNDYAYEANYHLNKHKKFSISKEGLKF